MMNRLMAKVGARKASDLLVTMAIHVPRWTVFSLGIMGAGMGFLFLILPGRFQAAPSLHVLLAVGPTVFWGAVFLAAGAALTTAALIDHTKSHGLLLCMAVLLCLFAGLSAAGAVVGTGTLVGPWLAIILGNICLFNAITTKAYPRLREMLRDKTPRAQEPR